MRTNERRGRAYRRRGGALVVVVVLIASMAVLSLSLMTSARSTIAERQSTLRDVNGIYVAEAALSEAVMELSSGGDGVVGSRVNPVSYGNGSFYVEATPLGAGTVALMATGTENGATTRVELIVRQRSQAFYQWAAFGDLGTTMDSNARSDSYDSSLGSYEDQAVNGSGSSTHARTNGDVGSNGDVTLQSNVAVFGDAVPGPTGTATLTGKASVSGTTVSAPDSKALPPLAMPGLPSTGDETIASGTVWPPGDHSFDHLVVEAGQKLVIQGPAVVEVVDFTLRSNSQLIVDDSAGAVEFFVHEDFVMDSNTLMSPASSDPAMLSVYLESDNILDPDTSVELATIELNSNAQLFGTIYAPNAHIALDSNFELFGSVISRSVHLDSNSFVHFDENLLRASGGGGDAGYETLCWRIAPAP